MPDSSQNELTELGFDDAMTELKDILARLDKDEVDLDEMSGLVERAAALIRLCRDRIETTEMKVQSIIGDLDADLGQNE